MSQTLKIAVWNANGLTQHGQEIKMFLQNQKIDIMLISETHYTNKSYLKIPKYNIYDTKHPDGTAHGGAAIIIRSSLKHHEIDKHYKDYLQATSIVVEDWRGPIVFSAVYCPPKHRIKKREFEEFYNMLGQRFIAAGDYNAKHYHWGSRLITSRGRELMKAMQSNNLQQLSTGQPTYWPTDRRKLPDTIDFCVTKGIARNYMSAESCMDLSSDHSPIILTVGTKVIIKPKTATLFNHKTDWVQFRNRVHNDINLNIPLKTNDEINEAVQHLTICIQEAAWDATPSNAEVKEKDCPSYIKEKIGEKRKLRKKWQQTRHPRDKKRLNKATKQLRDFLLNIKNQAIQDYLQNLTPTQATDYSLWKATKKLKQPQKRNPPIRMPNQQWARSDEEKAEVFVNHLADVFNPYPANVENAQEEDEIIKFLDVPVQMDLPIRKFHICDITAVIKSNLDQKKAPGYDLINGRILKEMPEKGYRIITYIMNAILRTGHFPPQWKTAEIILIPKPGKPHEEVTSYRPISLLPCLSKLFEKLLLQRLKPILVERQIIPDHQFGFRHEHATIEQVHRIVDVIRESLERKQYCSALFLDISQAFDKVWHPGLLYKLKKLLPHPYYMLLKSYLTERTFRVKHQNTYTTVHEIKSGVPQGSVLGPPLYVIYTADMPTAERTTLATFADDTAILASHRDPTKASEMLQSSLNNIQQWLQKWRIRVNSSKSNHVTFTMKRGTCPPVVFNNQPVPQTDFVKYLGMHLDRRLTWKKHIQTKRKQLGLKLTQMYWLIGHNSALSINNKLLLYKAILKPIWTYGIQLWGTASNSNIEIIQRFQSKILRLIAGAPWFVTNDIIQRDMNMLSIRDEIRSYSDKYQLRLANHPNRLANNLLTTAPTNRLKRYNILDLPNRH